MESYYSRHKEEIQEKNRAYHRAHRNPTGRRILPEQMPEYVAKIKKLYLEGRSSVEIGLIMGKDHTTILRHLGTLARKKPHPKEPIPKEPVQYKSRIPPVKTSKTDSLGRPINRSYKELVINQYGRVPKGFFE